VIAFAFDRAGIIVRSSVNIDLGVFFTEPKIGAQCEPLLLTLRLNMLKLKDFIRGCILHSTLGV
jgi:hypothetical protein